MARLDCSPAELDAVATALRLPLWRFPFAAPRFGGHGQPVRFAAAKASLQARGLVDGADFAPHLRDTLTAFAAGQVAIAVSGQADGATLTAAVVVHRARAVIAQQRDDRIVFQTISAERAATAAVTLLPPRRPAPGGPLTIAAAAIPATAPTYSHQVRPATTRPTAAHDARAADRLLTAPRRGGGCFLVTAPTRSESIAWLDTDSGRHAVLRTPAHITYTPADNARLATLLQRSLTTFA